MADDSEKADELRDVFESVTDETTVTEEREEERGTLRDEEAIRRDLRELVEEAVEERGIDTSLSADELVAVVRGYFEGRDDAAIADAVDADAGTVRRARVQLDLVREEDRDAPMDLDAVRDRLDEGATTSDLAERFDVAEGTARFYARVAKADRRAGRAGGYRDRFASVVQADVADDLTSSAQTDGLEGATEDMEVDVDI